MDAVAEAPVAGRAERLYRAAPLLSVFLWLCVVYAWEARGHVTPWLYSDELSITHLSRSIAETGEATRRGEAYSGATLWAYAIAPFWWIDDVGTAYAAIKYFSVVVMTSALFPAYFLARMLVGRPAALFAAAGTAAAPALAYSAFLLEEPAAYPWATLCFFLIVKALTERKRAWLTAATAACLIAPFVRGELALMIAVYAAAAIFLFWTSERMRRWRARWTAWDWIGFVVLGCGGLILASSIAGSLSGAWLLASGSYRGRTIEYGLWTAGALTIGIGVLPALVGLAALARPRREQWTRQLKAFVATALAMLIFTGLYAATKASYLSTVFATRNEERNLIYVIPVLLVATALWLERPRLNLVAAFCATGFVAYVVLFTPYRMDVRLDSDAFGLSILQWANRNIGLTPEAAKWYLLAILAVVTALIGARQLLVDRRRLVVGLGGGAAVLVVAWSLAGQISAGTASNEFARNLLRNFPSPPTWLDDATRGKDTLYLGQRIDDATGIQVMEFWNRSLRHVWSLDGTAPGPGFVLTPDLAKTNGALFPDPEGVEFVVATEGVEVFGPSVFQPKIRRVITMDEFGFETNEVVIEDAPWQVVRLIHPLRLASAPVGIYRDGWMSEFSSFSQFQTLGAQAGWAVITVSREGWRGPDRPGRVTVRVGTLVQGKDHQPAMGRVTAVRRWTIHSGTKRVFVIPTPKPPIRMEVRVKPTFAPRDYGSSDPRQLGAQVSYAFSVRKPATR